VASRQLQSPRYENDIDFQVYGSTTVKANFFPSSPAPVEHTMTVSATGGSTVIKANHNIFTFDDPAGETVTVHENDPFYLYAMPDPGFDLKYWAYVRNGQTFYKTGSLISHSTIQEARSYTAHLVRTAELEIETEGQGVVTSDNFFAKWNPEPCIENSNVFDPHLAGNSVTMTAEPCDGWSHDHWEYKDAGGIWQTAASLTDHLSVFMSHPGTCSFSNHIHIPAGENKLSVKAVFEDTFCSGGEKQDPCAPDAQIIDADITENRIETCLGGISSGLFTLELTGPEGAYYLIFQGTRDPGNYYDNFMIESLPEDEYTSVVVTWEIGQYGDIDTFQEHFRNLGVYRHSQYNLPAESETTCQGIDVNVCFSDDNCNYDTGTLPDTFRNEVEENGSGNSIYHGVIKPDTFCNDCSGLDIYREFCDFTGSCGGTPTETTVAQSRNHPYLNCDDRVYIFGLDIIKTVNGEGGGLVEEQLDNFTSNGECTGIYDLGNYITIKLFE
jgi:hypothetical protein